MELYKEMLAAILEKSEIQVTFPGLEEDISKTLQSSSYEALCRIKAILEDDSLDDPECFQKIEEIVGVFMSLGSGCAGRHDFG